MSESPKPFIMRSVCQCGSAEGTLTETGAQDVVRCARCNKFQYNAPRTETGKAVRSVSTTHAAIGPKRRAEILLRANWRCECCGRKPEKPTDELHVGHAVSVADGHAQGLGDDEINSDENLLAMCSECNLGLGRESIPAWLAAGIIKARTAGAKK